jgi:hypothetical protein
MLGNKMGIYNFAISNVVWIFLGFVLMNSLGTAIGNAVFLVINIRGYINWKNLPEEKIVDY